MACILNEEISHQDGMSSDTSMPFSAVFMLNRLIAHLQLVLSKYYQHVFMNQGPIVRLISCSFGQVGKRFKNT